ncbi:M23 family metallopeptidase [Paracoccus sp. MC1862]|nr:M23 family metallopeptidase [Paracoccus sp. MC1854]MBB1498318.1 M23 family metallopeptidase [Paracoccus sp. MC1862]
MTVAGLGRLQMPQIQWPRGAAAAGTTAAAGSGTAQVSDPFAGQGVRQPAVQGAGAPTTSAAPSGGGAVASARLHTVVAGETAWSIARRYGVPVQDLARANGLPETMSLRVGQRLAIPASGAVTTANVVTAPGVGSATPRPPSSAQPLPGEETRPASAPAPRAPAPDLGSTRTAASGSGKFAMPASGSIARAYRKGTNEGIDIAAAPGSPIKAAGSGTVAAVTRDTDGIPIVVVRHDDGLMTVYAGVDKLSVNKGDSVSRGQTIGAARSSGLLHFEVRNGFDSVDPEDYL